MELRVTFFAIVFFGLFLALPADAATLSRTANNLGIAAYWSFDEGTGGVVNDQSNRGNRGTTTAEWVAGRVGKAISINSNEVMYAGGTLPNRGTDGEVTMSAWLKPSNLTGTRTVFSKGASGGCFNYGMVTNNAFLALRQTSGDFTLSSSTLRANEWVHVAIVSANGSSTGYINGVRAGSVQQGTANCSANQWTIGRRAPNAASEYFAGAIDEFRIHHRALSASEIATLYQTGGAQAKAPNNLDLIGYWSFNEGAGTRAIDYSGKGNRGTLVNAPTWVNGRVGKALEFNGSNNYVNLGNVPGPSNAVTITAWIYKDTDAAWRSIIDRYGSESLDCLSLGFDNSTGRKLMFMWDSSAPGWANKITANSDVPTGRWVHVAVSSDGSTATFYVNGVADGGGSVGAPCTTGDMYIGANFPGGDEYFDGKIDEVRMYSRALSAAEIQSIYRGGQAVVNTSSHVLTQDSSLSSGLVGHWTFDGADTNTTIADRSSSANHGYFIGGATSTAKVIGKLGQALRFDGVDDRVDAGSASSLDNLLPATYSVWVKPSSLANYGFVIAKTTSGATHGHLVVHSNAWFGVYRQSSSGTNMDYKSSNGLISVGVWSHIVAVVNADRTAKLYLNGAEVAYQQTSQGTGSVLDDSSGNLTIGRRDFASDPAPFNGAVDDVRIYNRALTAAEVQQLYRLGQ